MDCFATLAMTQFVISVIIIQLCTTLSLRATLVARQSIYNQSRTYLLDCFVSLAMNPSMQKQAIAQFEQIRGYAQGTQHIM